MLRHLGLIAVCACLVASAGCEGGKVTAPAPDLNATVEFSGHMVNADAEGSVGMYTTFLASAFRSIRFGFTEAHGKGIALQINRWPDEGAFIATATAHSALSTPRSRVPLRMSRAS